MKITILANKSLCDLLPYMGMRYLLFQDLKVSFSEIIFIIQQLLKHSDIPGCQFLTKIAVRRMSLISSFLRVRGETLIEIISI